MLKLKFKLQATFEALLIITFLSTFFILVFYSFLEYKREIEKNYEDQAYYDLCYKISDYFSFISKLNSNLTDSLILDLDTKIEIKDYTVNIITKNKNYTCSTSIEKINGILAKGKNKIIKINNEIYVS